VKLKSRKEHIEKDRKGTHLEEHFELEQIKQEERQTTSSYRSKDNSRILVDGRPKLPVADFW